MDAFGLAVTRLMLYGDVGLLNMSERDVVTLCETYALSKPYELTMV